MKLPKTAKKQCRKCKKTTEHKISTVKSRGRSATHPLSRGSTRRMKLRGLRRGVGNQGRFSKPAVAKFKRTGAKTSTVQVIKFTCNVCKAAQQKVIGRAKKVEFE